MINFIHRVKGSETDYFPPYYQKKVLNITFYRTCGYLAGISFK